MRVEGRHCGPRTGAKKVEKSCREEAAGKSARQVRQMLADVDPELAPPADRVRPLGDGCYELKATIDADCQQGLEQLRGLLLARGPAHDAGAARWPACTGGLDRHDPSRPPRRARSGSRRADAKATAPPTPTPEQAHRRSAPAAKHAPRPADIAAAPKTDPNAGSDAASTSESQPAAQRRVPHRAGHGPALGEDARHRRGFGPAVERHPPLRGLDAVDPAEAGGNAGSSRPRRCRSPVGTGTRPAPPPRRWTRRGCSRGSRDCRRRGRASSGRCPRSPARRRWSCPEDGARRPYPLHDRVVPFGNAVLEHTEPLVVRMPAVIGVSLIEIGSPCRGPRASPRCTACSAALACSRARSGVSSRKEYSRPSSRSMRSRKSSVSSTGETCPAAISRSNSVADAYASSSLSLPMSRSRAVRRPRSVGCTTTSLSAACSVVSVEY